MLKVKSPYRFLRQRKPASYPSTEFFDHLNDWLMTAIPKDYAYVVHAAWFGNAGNGVPAIFVDCSHPCMWGDRSIAKAIIKALYEFSGIPRMVWKDPGMTYYLDLRPDKAQWIISSPGLPITGEVS